MHAFTKLTQSQFKLYMREPVALFFTVIFPALLLVLFGAIWGNDAGYAGPHGYIDLQVPALSGIVIGTVALASIPITTATNRELKILRRFKATPMRSSTYIAADITVNFLVALLSMIVLVAIGRLLFGLRFGGNWAAVLGGFLLSALSFMSFGYIIASLAPTGRIAQVAGQLLYFPMMFLSGAALPLQIMPDGIRQVAQWLPMTHMVKLLQDLWFGNGWDGTAVAVLGGLLVVGGIVSARIFRWE